MSMALFPQGLDQTSEGTELLIEIAPPHDDDIAKLITEGGIERPHFAVLGADVEIDGPDALRLQPRLGGTHCRLPQALALDGRRHRNIIEPAAMAVVTDHDRRNDFALYDADENLGISLAAGES